MMKKIQCEIVVASPSCNAYCMVLLDLCPFHYSGDGYPIKYTCTNKLSYDVNMCFLLFEKSKTH